MWEDIVLVRKKKVYDRQRRGLSKASEVNC